MSGKSRVVTAGSLNFPEATKIGYGMPQELTIVENDVLGARQREARKKRRRSVMTVNKIFGELELVDDATEVFIGDENFPTMAHGNWYQDDVMEYAHSEVKSFTWQDDNKLYIELK